MSLLERIRFRPWRLVDAVVSQGVYMGYHLFQLPETYVALSSRAVTAPRIELTYAPQDVAVVVLNGPGRETLLRYQQYYTPYSGLGNAAAGLASSNATWSLASLGANFSLVLVGKPSNTGIRSGFTYVSLNNDGVTHGSYGTADIVQVNGMVKAYAYIDEQVDFVALCSDGDVKLYAVAQSLDQNSLPVFEYGAWGATGCVPLLVYGNPSSVRVIVTAIGNGTIWVEGVRGGSRVQLQPWSYGLSIGDLVYNVSVAPPGGYQGVSWCSGSYENWYNAALVDVQNQLFGTLAQSMSMDPPPRDTPMLIRGVAKSLGNTLVAPTHLTDTTRVGTPNNYDEKVFTPIPPRTLTSEFVACSSPIVEGVTYDPSAPDVDDVHFRHPNASPFPYIVVTPYTEYPLDQFPDGAIIHVAPLVALGAVRIVPGVATWCASYAEFVGASGVVVRHGMRIVPILTTAMAVHQDITVIPNVSLSLAGYDLSGTGRWDYVVIRVGGVNIELPIYVTGQLLL